jgi:hypothetical protein
MVEERDVWYIIINVAADADIYIHVENHFYKDLINLLNFLSFARCHRSNTFKYCQKIQQKYLGRGSEELDFSSGQELS